MIQYLLSEGVLLFDETFVVVFFEELNETLIWIQVTTICEFTRCQEKTLPLIIPFLVMCCHYLIFRIEMAHVAHDYLKYDVRGERIVDHLSSLNVSGMLDATNVTITGVTQDDAENRLLVLDTGTDIIKYRSAGSLPGGNPFDQTLNQADAATFSTVDTGQGTNELYPMDQAVTTVSPVNFSTVNTGHGANFLYRMDQNVRTIDSPTFAAIDTGQGANEVHPMDQPVRTTDPVIFSTVNTGQGANVLHPMNQPLLTTSDVLFNRVDTGQGLHELHFMDQGVGTVDSPSFVTQTLTGVTQDDAQDKLLVLDSVSNVVEYRDVSSLPVVASTPVWAQIGRSKGTGAFPGYQAFGVIGTYIKSNAETILLGTAEFTSASDNLLTYVGTDPITVRLTLTTFTQLQNVVSNTCIDHTIFLNGANTLTTLMIAPICEAVAANHQSGSSQTIIDIVQNDYFELWFTNIIDLVSARMIGWSLLVEKI